MKKIYLVLLGLFFLNNVMANKTQQIFTEVEESAVKSIPQIKATTYKTMKVDLSMAKNYLQSIPKEFTAASVQNTYLLQLPMPDGTWADFDLEESPMMEAGLAAQFPTFKTYTGKGITDPSAYLKLSITDKGLHAMILSAKGTIYIDPYNNQTTNLVMVYDKKDFDRNGKVMNCLVGDASTNSLELEGVFKNENTPTPEMMFGDCQRRDFRLAMAATGEYTTFHGGTVPLALAAIVVSVNRINGVYEKEFGVHFNLVANNSLIIYTNGATDPYTNNSGSTMLNENQSNLTTVIGTANYDVGHVFSTGGGGIAQLNSPCSSTGKARGVTGSGAPVGDPFDIDYVAHEMGHQFGGNHTQNNNCNRALAVETGSGVTIMGYAGICAPDVAAHSIDNFHSSNLIEITNFLASANAGCRTLVSVPNNSPVISSSTGNHTIPKSTPFALTCTASDADGDVMTYNWDQFDNQVSTQSPLSTNTGGPNFRCFSSTLSPTWYFPTISSISTNTNDPWQVLPSVARTMNFRLTVRDNHSGNGCTASATSTITFDGTAGPFVVSSPSTTGISYPALSTQTITWSVAGTNVAPVNCSNVDILLSTDGGLTYPTTILSNTPNDGSESVLIPNSQSTTARIMVKANGNVFFDISNNNFAITAPVIFTITAGANANGSISPSGAVSVASGANQTFTISPNPCFQIASVLVDGVNNPAAVSSGTFTFTNVTAAHTIQASFSPITYSITATASSNGSISPSGINSVNCGSNQTYTITPNFGFSVFDVMVDGISIGAVTSHTFTNVTAPHTISATFVAQVLNFTITASAGANGSISPSGAVNVTGGSSQTFIITPNSCYAILDVIVDGISQGPFPSYTFTNVNAPHTITATFVQLTYTILANAGPDGSISPALNTTVNCGANQTYTITPNLGFNVLDVLVDGISIGAVTSHTFTNVTAAHTISATFVAQTVNHTITATAGANGNISPSGVVNVTGGANQTFLITPNSCYTILDVSVDGISQGPLTSYTFTNVNISHTIDVTFINLTYTILASAGANGSVSPAGSTTVNCGTNQSYSISANGGYFIQDVLVDGISQGAVSSYTFTNVTTNHTISASFAQNTVGTTTLTVASCNSTVATMNDQVFIYPVAGATNYRYKVENSTLGFNSVYTRNSSLTDFRLKWAPGVQFATTYSISVAALVGGIWGTYGAACPVTVGPFPSTQLSNCATVLPAMSTAFTCVPVSGASNYQYRFTNTSLSYSYEAYRNNSSTDYRLTWLPSNFAAQYSTTYNVEVRALVGGIWGTYGNVCTITTPSAPITSLQPAFCSNYALPTFSSAVNCVAIAGASNYRYKITGPASYSKVFTRNSSLTDWRFSWTLLCCGQQNMLANSTYTVEVAYFAGGTWSAYGPACTIVTPGTVPRYAFKENEEVTLDEPVQEFTLSVFPNPSTLDQEVSIEISGFEDIGANVEFAIFDLMGKKVYANSGQLADKNNFTIKPEYTFTKGIYLAEARMGATVKRVKFIVE
ncbi:MAG: T9SS type A sorting domain-containing protein [Bacteroidetes bacterium]|nr:T9SS type A sorting domain-containing protein [Bacteroidota bacterium]